MTPDFPRSEPRYALAHATGFCAGVWDPVVRALGSEGVLRWSFAGHGGYPPPPFPLSWWRFGHQALSESKPGMIGVGHSMGGAALVMAELLSPGHFDSLVLIEPVIFPSYDPAIAEGMADGASRRRDTFGGRAEARRLFSAKDVFARWDPEALDGYLREGLIEDATGVRLACSPDFEAEVYRTYFDESLWARLGEVGCPVLVICGSDSDTYGPGQVDRIARQFRRATALSVVHAGHFLPMEAPLELARLIERFVRSES